MRLLRLACLAALAASAFAGGGGGGGLDAVFLTLGYCPSAFSGKGAVVKVNSETGQFNITGHPPANDHSE